MDNGECRIIAFGVLDDQAAIKSDPDTARFSHELVQAGRTGNACAESTRLAADRIWSWWNGSKLTASGTYHV
jgi:hypothetical protein